MSRFSGTLTSINRAVAVSPVGYYFRLDGSGHPLARPGSRFLTEIRAGCVTFAAMAYILSVNASILTQSGGPCRCPNSPQDPFCAQDAAYKTCLVQLNRDYVFSTGVSACIGSLLLGLMANLPLGIAPGLGENAYFAFTIVGVAGTGILDYGKGLAVVWMEGWIFFILSLLGIRQWLARLIPHSIKLSTGAGIGLFLCFVGLGPSGLGVVGRDPANLVGLAGCPAQYLAKDGSCISHILQDPKVWLGVFAGGILTGLALIYRIKGAFLIGIILVSVISWPRTTSVTLFPHTDDGNSNFDYFKQVANWNGLGMLGPKNIDWSAYSEPKLWASLIALLYIDLLDTTGTLYAMASHAGLMDPRTGDFEGSSAAYLADGVAISIGSLVGCSPNTAFIESASGIAEGGRTGITAIVVSFLFFLSLFFAPIFSNIPPWATGSTLIIVGSMMASNTAHINWSYVGDAVPAFITLFGIPIFFNIAYGLIAGVCTYICLNGIPWLLIQVTGGRLVPFGWDTVKEPWGLRLVSANGTGETGFRSILPPWVRKLLAGNLQFWKLSDEEIEFYLEGRRQTAIQQEHEEHIELERSQAYGVSHIENHRHSMSTSGEDDLGDEKRISPSPNHDLRHTELPHSSSNPGVLIRRN